MNTDILKVGNAFDLGSIHKNNKVSGAKKAAVLLMSLGNDVASSIIKNLPEKQIQRIGVEIANIHTINASDRRTILKEFVEMNKEKEFILEGGMDCAKSIINGALGNQKGDKILEVIKYDAYTKIFMSARKADVDKILNCIQGESAQTIAIILAHIQSEKSAQILCKLPEKLQEEVALKVGSMSNISPAIIRAVDITLEKKLNDSGSTEIDSSNGVDSLVEILTNVDRKTEKNILSFLESKNNSLAEKIKSSMFVFEDIANLDSISIQKVLKEVNLKDIAIALKGSPEEVSETIFKNQSQRASQVLREEIYLLGSVKVSQVEESQQNIVSIVRRLDSEGAITLVRSPEDELVV
ncbi:flagellar motor switch protein FliG [Romboutsia weinsteinii]|uniref:Flagellar motor switch protein FliG n=1 Tax=Romboutsia weinsteinii TaxID=2020949 RepID=A0A371J8K2_9FIRM|nr:flagellar motor switch protein FliG [Romboutsia weinsteinii]RDY29055.1 flagellar motor switch protein FliG [Romboutsia weinsteinii]